MFFEIGSYFQSASWAHDTGVSCSPHLSTGGHLAKIAAHAAAGGILQHLQGGRFGSGFLAAGATETLSPAIEDVDHVAGRILTAAMIGGTVSTLSGGKFANGAATAAFAYAFSAMASRAASGSGGEWIFPEGGSTDINDYDSATSSLEHCAPTRPATSILPMVSWLT
jgi:hypothetical protein